MDKPDFELTSLALEYQRDYGTAQGNLDISDFVNNPFINSPTSIFALMTTPKSPLPDSDCRCR